MYCPACHAEIDEASNFCKECGYGIKKSLQSTPDAHPVPKSYTPKHLADKILTTRNAIEGERKIVTVLFADVANYTSIAEKLDPEAVHQIMDGCFKILMEKVHKHEGTINQFTGDGVMAVFGAPLAYEDHGQRACSAALSIQEALQDYSKFLNDKFGVTFNMRIGLNSGPVVIGSIGDDLRMDYTAIGDTTNLAARMETLAKPGAILVSKNTYRKVSPYFEFEPLGKIDIKGKEVAQEAYELLRQRDIAHIGFTRQIYSDMVGRDEELNRLELQVMKAINGEGSIVNVIGEAGIGKSRLIAELKQKDFMRKVAVREGRTISIGKGLSFHPIIDIYKNWAKIKEDDNDTIAVGKLEASIRNITPKDVHEILPFIAKLMGIKLKGRYAERVKGIEGEALEKLILKNVKDLLVKSSEIIPLVIVIEDLHWADLSTIELLESLFRLAETQKILFINVFRPRYTETGVRIVKTVKERFPNHYVEIELQPLDEQMSETLISNILHVSGLPHGVRGRIVKRAEGNPFFIEEVVRSLIDEGAIVRKNGGFQVTEKIDSVVIPHAINDILIARIDRLEDRTRDLVKTASVIGRSFFYRILTEVVKSVEDIDERLKYLTEIQLIRERKRMEELEYLFKHALAQEAAYESLLVQKRKKLHLIVAQSIEKVFGEKLYEFYGMLAYHYGRGGDDEKAEEYLIKAGKEALQSSASSEALYYYQEALNIYLRKYGNAADPEKIAMLEKNIALAFFYRGQDEDAVVYFDSVLKRMGFKRPKSTIGTLIRLILDVIFVIANLYFPTKRPKKAPSEKENEIFELGYKKTASLVHINPWRNFTEGFANLRRSYKFDIRQIQNGVRFPLSGAGMFTYTCLSLKLAKRCLEYGGSVIDASNNREVMQHAMYETLWMHFSGNWSELKEYDESLVDVNLRIGEFWHASVYLIFSAFTKIDLGEFKVARSLEKKLSEIAEVYEYDPARAYQYTVKAHRHIRTRNLHDAKAEADAGVSYTKKIGMQGMQLMVLGLKAYSQILLGEISEAEQTLMKAKEVSSAQRLVPPLYINDCLIAQSLFDIHLLEKAILSGDKLAKSKYKKKALRSGGKALKCARKYAFRRVEVFRFLGIYNSILGQQKKAANWWKEAAEEGERLGARPALARTYMEIGRRCLEEKIKYKELNGISAKEYLEKARTMFEEMELQWDLDELDRIVA